MTQANDCIRIVAFTMSNIKSLHFHHTIAASADNLIGYKINTVHFVRVTG